VLLAAAVAMATPGQSNGNYVFFNPNAADPTNGSLTVVSSYGTVYTWRASSGTSVASNNVPCNKSTTTSIDGGRLPGSESSYGTGNLRYDSPNNGDGRAWEPNLNLGGWTSKALHAQNMNAVNPSSTVWLFDCPPGGTVQRTQLWVHRQNSSWVSYGCIKIIKMNDLGSFYHDASYWDGVNAGPYSDTIVVSS